MGNVLSGRPPGRRRTTCQPLRQDLLQHPPFIRRADQALVESLVTVVEAVRIQPQLMQTTMSRPYKL